MKKFLVLLLVAHFLLEIIVGAMFAFNPTSMVSDPDPRSLMFLINLGAVVIAAAFIAVWIWPYRNNLAALSVGLGVIATFHTGAALAGLYCMLQGLDGSAAYPHGVLAAGFWFLWFRRQTLVS